MTPDSPAWLAAKAQGDRAELAVAEWFRGRGWEPYKSLGLASIDLLLQCFVEIKYNPKATQTGKVAIETAYRGQASGILNSPANFWAVVAGDVAYIAKLTDLQDFVLRGGFQEVSAGDEHAARVRLVPIEKLAKARGIHPVELQIG